MKKSMLSEAEIAFLLKRADEGTAVAEVCRLAVENAKSFSELSKTPHLKSR